MHTVNHTAYKWEQYFYGPFSENASTPSKQKVLNIQRLQMDIYKAMQATKKGFHYDQLTQAIQDSVKKNIFIKHL